MSITLTALMKQRRDTAANWTTANPTLLAGEIGIESDTFKWKVGDGSAAWNSLAYIPGLSISAYPLVDADIASNAEIAVSKLANGTARQLLQTDAAGTGVEFASNIDIPGTLDVTGAATFDNAVTIQGDLTVNGTTTTIDTANLAVEDKNIEIGKVASPTDTTADGGGITLKGDTDKTINWIDATDAWTFSEHVDLASTKEYRIAGSKVLDATSLGSAVVSSSLTSVGTIATGTWQGTAIDKTYLDATLVSTGDTGTVTSTMIADGTIVDADINASAAIAPSKLGTGNLPSGITGSSLTSVGTLTAGALGTGFTTVVTAQGGTGQTTYANGELLIGKADGTLAKATLTASTGVTITNGDGSITISATGSGGTVTSVTATSPVASTGGNTPDISIQDGTTTQKGAVQLEDSTSSTSTIKAATPNSVKSAYDLADAALPKAGGTLTGDVTLGNQSDLRFGEATANGTNYVAFQAPASITADVTWTLPDADGTTGQALTTNGTGTLSWAAAGGNGFDTGTVMLFQQTSAPTGWTKLTTHDNKALRIVSGTVGSGGSTAFTSVFASRTPSGSVSGSNSSGSVSAHTLTTSQIPSHSHSFPIHSHSGSNGTFTEGGANTAVSATKNTDSTGGGSSHTHGFTDPTWSGSFTGSAMDFAVQYVDVIMASKD